MMGISQVEHIAAVDMVVQGLLDEILWLVTCQLSHPVTHKERRVGHKLGHSMRKHILWNFPPSPKTIFGTKAYEYNIIIIVCKD